MHRPASHGWQFSSCVQGCCRRWRAERRQAGRMFIVQHLAPSPFTIPPLVYAAGLLQVLACVKAAGEGAPRVHVYGFNWSGKHWLTHQVWPQDWFEEPSPSDAQLPSRHCWLLSKLSKPECRWARRLCVVGTWLDLAGTAPRVEIFSSLRNVPPCRWAPRRLLCGIWLNPSAWSSMRQRAAACARARRRATQRASRYRKPATARSAGNGAQHSANS